MRHVLSWFVDNLDFLATVLVAIAVSLLMATGRLKQDQLPIATVGLLVTLSLFMAIKNYRLGSKIHGIEFAISDVQKRLSGSTTRLLLGSEEFFGTLNSVITNMSKLEVTYFSPAPPDELAGTEVAKYWKTVDRNLKRYDSFRVRRIVTIESETKLRWVRQTLKDSNTSPNFHLAAVSAKQSFPLLNVVIVDARYSVVFEPHSQSSDSPYIFIDDTKTAEALHKYFESLWSVAIKLKVAKHLYEDNFLTIEEQLNERL